MIPSAISACSKAVTKPSMSSGPSGIFILTSFPAPEPQRLSGTFRSDSGLRRGASPGSEIGQGSAGGSDGNLGQQPNRKSKTAEVSNQCSSANTGFAMIRFAEPGKCYLWLIAPDASKLFRSRNAVSCLACGHVDTYAPALMMRRQGPESE